MSTETPLNVSSAARETHALAVSQDHAAAHDASLLADASRGLAGGSGLELAPTAAVNPISAAARSPASLLAHAGSPAQGCHGYLVSQQSLPVVKAQPVNTSGAMTAIEGFGTIARACLEHLAGNERGVCESDNPEFVHQARVAIRRLRSALRVWKPALPVDFIATFDPSWQRLAQHLGEARNWDVFMAETLPTIAAAFPWNDEVDRLALHALEQCATHRQAARRALRAPAHTRLERDFVAALAALPDAGSRHLEHFAPRCLDKRARQVHQRASQAIAGDAAARHTLRVAYKRLRYALEFFAPLYPGETLRSYHVAASRLQELLGRLNDLAVADELVGQALPHGAGDDIRAWLTRRSDTLLPELGDLLADFQAQPVPWRDQTHRV